MLSSRGPHYVSICERRRRQRASAYLVATLALTTGLHVQDAASKPLEATRSRLRTYANPVDLPYRFQKIGKSFRESADPTVITFKGKYWLFPSHSMGYWYSKDLLKWTFVHPTDYDTEHYAPDVVQIGDQLLLTEHKYANVVTTSDPESGEWMMRASLKGQYSDPHFFLDDDGKLFLYDGSSPTSNIHVRQLDRDTLEATGTSVDIPQTRDIRNRGWEVQGEHNEKNTAPSYIEGSWMTKYKGRYYLQYAAPATEGNSYADGVVVGDTPTGPFTYQSYSPFSSKPTGFIGGAGHGSTFQDLNGRWWHVATMSISKRFLFERRIGLFPAEFTSQGELVADTYLGDYPHYIDGDRGLTGWMLLSRNKAVTVSSTEDGFPAANSVDENVRTWWSAKTGDAGEWLQIDLGGQKQIQAVQINFADEKADALGISTDSYLYRLELSRDGKSWRTVIYRSRAGVDAPHDYEVLPQATDARFVRLTNVHSPNQAKFSISDLRVFGNGNSALPDKVTRLAAVRDKEDPRKAAFSWDAVPGAEFYVLRLGTRPGLLIQNYQIYDGQTSVDVGALNAGVTYYYAVDAVNDRGIARGAVIGFIN